MNKTKKGFLSAASILTIVASSFAILGSVIFFILGSVFTEELVKESYMEDSLYTYGETVEGEYFFTYVEDGEEMIIMQEDIQIITKICKIFCNIVGVVSLAFGVAKLILSIRILTFNGREKYAKGTTTALLVLSILNFSVIESVLIIVAMCQKDNNEHIVNKTTPPEIDISDIQLD